MMGLSTKNKNYSDVSNTELYSSGKMYYKETNVAISLNPKITLPIGVFIWDLNAIVNDAHARNSSFLNLIKSKFIY